MTQGFPNQRPFSMTVVKHNALGISGGATGYMITRAPWQTGSAKYYVISKLFINNVSATNSGAPLSLAIWDQDLSNTSPVARGSALGPLMSVPLQFNASGVVGATSGLIGPYGQLTVVGRDQLPREYFQGGITVAAVQAGAALASISGTTVSFELDVV